ncbi:MAG: nuclease, partial [Bacteroidota bacterium]
MKHLITLFALLMTTTFVVGQSDLIITGVIDGPLPGGTPKAVELYALADIPDLSIYGLGAANNGGGSDGEEFTFPAVSLAEGSFIYITTDNVQFEAFFGFSADYV